jgi:fused signal recognition particle receptor
VVLVTGINGVGKTTTIGKLAALHARAGRKVLLVAADTFRAAAIDQLGIWAERTGADLVRHAQGGAPAAVVFDGMKAANARGIDVVLVDTAGRLHTQDALMGELEKMHRVMAREIPGAPHETLLVLDATTGQNALKQARAFGGAVGLTGVVVTKLDGTARGGMLLAVHRELGTPVHYLGVGEGVDDLRPFDADEFAAALFDDAPVGTS